MIIRFCALLQPIQGLINTLLITTTLMATSSWASAIGSIRSPGLFPQENFRFTAVANQQLEQIGIQKSITQDQNGFIWVGGENGLARFDAYEIKLYKHDDTQKGSLSNNFVTDLLVDHSGHLWVSTASGLNKYNPSNDDFEHFYHLPNNSNSLSNSSIISMSEIAPGTLGLASYGGGLNLLDIESRTVTRFLHNENDPNSISDNIVLKILTDSRGKIWLGTRSHWLEQFDPKTKRFTHFNEERARIKALNLWPLISSLYEDAQNNLWVATATEGLYKINSQGMIVQQYKNIYQDPTSLADNIVWEVYEDNQKNLWVATDSALNLYHQETDSFTYFKVLPDSNQPGKVRSLYQDQDNNLWFGLFPSGTAILNQEAMIFKNYLHSPHDPNSLSNSSITAIAEDRKGNLWVGTEVGLNYLDRTSKTITRYFHKPNDPNSLSSDAILSIFIDSFDTVWIGTWRGGWSRFNPLTSTFTAANMQGDGQHMSSEVWNIYEDNNQTLWIAGLYKYIREKDLFIPFQNPLPTSDPLNLKVVRDMLDDQYGNLWLATTSGLEQLDRNTNALKKFRHNESNPLSVSSNAINCLFEDSKGTLWIGTRGGGIDKFNETDQTFSTYSSKDGLPDDSITGIIEDKNGNLWMSTGHGISRFNPITESFKTYDNHNGLASTIYIRKALLVTSSNEIVVGGTRGLTIFDPSTIMNNPNPPPIVMTKLQVLNQDINSYGPRSPLKTPIEHAKEIVLSHSQSVFSLEYSALNYHLSEQNKYAYKLEGFDKQWNHVGGIRRATYTNLNPGLYTFRVKGSNDSDIWSPAGASININILPPWWTTWWAFLVYGLLFFVCIYFFIYLRIKLKLANNDRILNERLQQINKLKDTFLANTSHELRTPLNGIIGLTQSILDGSVGYLTTPLKENLEAILSSGKRLSNLTNDILDFSKLRNHTLQLTPIPLDIYPMVTSVIYLSKYLIGQKPINVICHLTATESLVFADEQRLQQILYNLLGNAVKFTHSGTITISSERKNSFAYISIADTGIGIKEADFDKIFQSFEQSSSTAGYTGTGLGLSVTKQLIELQGGEITLESTLGEGSTFTFSLPLATPQQISDFKAKESTIYNILEEILDTPANLVESDTTETMVMAHAHKILVVDDEPVNRLVLEKYLTNQNYRFMECTNGEEAIDILAKDSDIDLILLDVMMPGKNGYEVCQIIREHHPIHKLPIIFLTAKSRVEDLQKGYEVEGNDFLFKPVIKEELLAKISLHLKLSSICKEMEHRPQSI